MPWHATLSRMTNVMNCACVSTGWLNNQSQQAFTVLCEYLNTQQMKYSSTNLRLLYEAIQSH